MYIYFYFKIIGSLSICIHLRKSTPPPLGILCTLMSLIIRLLHSCQFVYDRDRQCRSLVLAWMRDVSSWCLYVLWKLDPLGVCRQWGSSKSLRSSSLPMSMYYYYYYSWCHNFWKINIQALRSSQLCFHLQLHGCYEPSTMYKHWYKFLCVWYFQV